MKEKKNVIGKKFGRLTVIGRLEDSNGYVLCKCDCGNLHLVKLANLTKKDRPTVSCGCYRKETSKKNVSKAYAVIQAESKKYGTNVGLISSKKLYKNNTSGHKGVARDVVHGGFQAYITLRKKTYVLGNYSEISDAVIARETAEKLMFDPIIRAKNASLPQYC